MSSGRPPPDTGTFGRYTALVPIGSGGMAVVYRANAVGPDGSTRPVVLKRLLPQLSGDQSAVRMLAEEARVISQLRHPNIVRLYEFGRAAGECYLAMELVDGTDLAKCFAELGAGEGVPLGIVCLIACEVAEALAYAHHATDSKGVALEVVHRDLSLSNVMVTRSGQVKLLDFGIARAANSLQDRTATGAVKGKLTYMAPEQLEGQRADARSDVYSLGVMVHELLTGQRLFRAESDLAVLRLRQQLRVVPPPSTTVAGVPREVDAVVTQMLEADPERRVADAGDIARRLRPFAATEAELAAWVAQHQPSKSDVDQTVSRLPAWSFTQTEWSSDLGASQERAARARWALATAALVTLSGGVAFLVWRDLASTDSVGQTPTLAPAPVVAKRPAEVVAPRPPEEVVLEFRGLAGARVALDGADAGVLPLMVRVPPRPEPWNVSVTQPGYEPFSTTVSGEHGASLDIALKRKPRNAAGPPPAKKRTEVSNPFK